MPFNPTTGVFIRTSNPFSDPVTGTIIDPADADELFDDYDLGFNSTFLEQQLFLSLSAGQPGLDTASAQTWFPGGGATLITLAANTTYMFRGELAHIRAAGTVLHNIGNLFSGTATLTSIAYHARAAAADASSFLNLTSNQVSRVESAVNTTIWNTVSSSANEVFTLRVEGMVRIAAAGTFGPQFQYSAAPGGAPTIRPNSWFMLSPLGTGTVLNQGPWT